MGWHWLCEEAGVQKAKLALTSYLVILLAAVGCAKSSSDGGQDGGGGHVLVSTSEQVHVVLQTVLDQALADDYRNDFFYSILTDQRQLLTEAMFHHSLDGEIVKKTEKTRQMVFQVVTGNKSALCVFEAVRPAPISGAEYCEKEYMAAPGEILPNLAAHHFRNILSQSHLRIEEDADCTSPEDPHTDASVTAFHPGAELCFSIARLRRIPPSDLMREISSLLFHEMAHLQGFGEADAQFLQATFSEFFAFRFGSLSDRQIRQNIDSSLEEADRRLKIAFDIPAKLGARFQTSILAQTVQLVKDMPAWREPMVLTMGLSLKHPEQAVKFTVSILNFLNDTQHFLFGYDQVMPGKEDWQGDAMPDVDQSHVLTVLQTARKRLDTIEMNWKKLKKDREGLTCDPIKDWPDSSLRFDFQLTDGLFDFQMLYGNDIDPAICAN